MLLVDVDAVRAAQHERIQKQLGDEAMIAGRRFVIRAVGEHLLVHFAQQLFETKVRSEEHTSELQSHVNLVCRLLLEKKKKKKKPTIQTKTNIKNQPNPTRTTTPKTNRPAAQTQQHNSEGE